MAFNKIEPLQSLYCHTVKDFTLTSSYCTSNGYSN